MEQYLNNISSFPTIVYTVLMAIVVFYWLLSIVGAVDADSLDMDMDMDIDMDADMDASGLSGLTGFMLKFGLVGVPITIIISIWVVYAWLACYFAAEYLLVLLPTGLFHTLGAGAVIVACFFMTIPLVARTIKPMHGLFNTHTAVKKKNLVGSYCTVRTLNVSEDFGQGELHDGEAGMILDIRAPQPNEITKGDKVVIINYNKAQSAFDVVTEKEFRM